MKINNQMVTREIHEKVLYLMELNIKNNTGNNKNLSVTTVSLICKKILILTRH